MVSIWTGDKGKFWQCDKCHKTEGPFEDEADAKEASKEHDCPAIQIMVPETKRR